jgi:hypothetical protein
MSAAADCHAAAKDLRDRAAEATDPDARDEYERLARGWDLLARRHEARESTPPLKA